MARLTAAGTCIITSLKKEYVDVIDPNTSIDNSPYERAVKKEQLDQTSGPFDNWFFRTLDLITAAGGGIGNAAKGKNTLHGGSYKSNNTANNTTKTNIAKSSQRPKTGNYANKTKSTDNNSTSKTDANTSWRNLTKKRREGIIITIEKKTKELDTPIQEVISDIIKLKKNDSDLNQVNNLSDILNFYLRPERTVEQKTFIIDNVLKPAQKNPNYLLPSATELRVQLKQQKAKKATPPPAPKTLKKADETNKEPAITKLPADFSFDETHISLANIKITVKDANANITLSKEKFEYSRLSNEIVDIKAVKGKSYEAHVTGVHTIAAIDYKTVTDIDPTTKKSTRKLLGTDLSQVKSLEVIKIKLN